MRSTLVGFTLGFAACVAVVAMLGAARVSPTQATPERDVYYELQASDAGGVQRRVPTTVTPSDECSRSSSSRRP